MSLRTKYIRKRLKRLRAKRMGVPYSAKRSKYSRKIAKLHTSLYWATLGKVRWGEDITGNPHFNMSELISTLADQNADHESAQTAKVWEKRARNNGIEIYFDSTVPEATHHYNIDEAAWEWSIWSDEKQRENAGYIIAYTDGEPSEPIRFVPRYNVDLTENENTIDKIRDEHWNSLPKQLRHS